MSLKSGYRIYFSSAKNIIIGLKILSIVLIISYPMKARAQDPAPATPEVKTKITTQTKKKIKTEKHSSLKKPLPAKKQDKVYIDINGIYLGDADNYKKPAVISIKDIIASHPGYKLVLKHNLNSEQAKYWILTDKINDDINKVLKQISRQSGWDLIGETGFITNSPLYIPDITDQVIKVIKGEDQ